MYTLTVVNKYGYDLVVDAADRTHIVNRGLTLQLPTLGNAIVNVAGIGQMLVMDIGERHIGGFSKASWGVFLAYQSEEVVFRYEGGGEITVTITDLGQAELSGNGAFSSIRLGAFRLPGQ